MAHKIEQVLANVNGASFIGIDTETIPTLAGGKKNPMQGQIRKVMIGANVMIFQNKNGSAYDAMVRRRLVAEGKDPDTFQLGERKWGERRTGTPFIEHNGQLYLEVIFLRPGKVEYKRGVRPIAAADVEGLKQHDEAEQGGLDNKVIIRTINVDNIKRIVVDGQAHEL